MSVEKKIPRIEIKIASPERIRELSGGEVKNYKTYELEVSRKTNKLTKEVKTSYDYIYDPLGNKIAVEDGLFDPKIFKKYKNCLEFKKYENKPIQYETLNRICKKCNKNKKCPYECPGYIELKVPVVHIWYFDTIRKILGLKKNSLKSILEDGKTFEAIEELKTQYDLDEASKKLIKYIETTKASDFYGISGASLIRFLLEQFDNSYENEIKRIKEHKSQTEKALNERLKLIEDIRNSGNKFTWMVLDVLPVVPPSIRPEINMNGSLFEDDLYYLYRSIIVRNNRIAKFKMMHAPLVILKNESRFLQHAVDALFNNEKLKNYQKKTKRGRPYKSLSEKLKGKQGIFRQNLLGKRVDYSGRSVIVPGPELKLEECGLPVDMAVELFRPFLIHELNLESIIDDIYEKNIINRNERIRYKKMLSNSRNYELKSIYNELCSCCNDEYQLPDFYNVLKKVVSNYPIILNRQPSLHRLSLQAFYPVLVDGKAIKLHPLMCKGFGADFDGDTMSIHVPLLDSAQKECKDLILSTKNLLDPANGRTIIAPSQDMVLGIYYMTAVKPKAKGTGKYFSSIDEVRMAVERNAVENQALIYVLHYRKSIKTEKKVFIETTPGRLFFNEELPDEIDFINQQLGEKGLIELIEKTLNIKGPQVTVKLVDALKDIGFKNATLYGASLSMEDMNRILSKKQKDDLLNTTNNEECKKLIKQYLKLEENQFNTISMMVNSGARGKPEQISQIIAMKGYIPKPHSSPDEEGTSVKITASYLKGLSTFDYFQSSSGTRKDLHNTKFSTADAGYLTRRLISTVQDVVIVKKDCGATMHSVLTCKCENGLCASCYGNDLALNQPVQLGTAVGIIAAQSIGQVFSQLVLKSKHNYGAAGEKSSDTIKNVNDLFEARKKTNEDINSELLLKALKEIYEDVDEKHIALIVRKMTQKDGSLQGITKVALNSDSFMAASSSQYTEDGLKSAALLGKKDELKGIIENVIPGNLIPAGTGFTNKEEA